jgi:DNA mismatch endonuclease, patch repair protein
LVDRLLKKVFNFIRMADTFSKEKRSWIMSRIKGKNTKPEMTVRQFLHKQGFRYRLHIKGLPGKPDLVLKKYKTVIFVHGCFWHGHEKCIKARLPKTQTLWWKKKMLYNSERDRNNQRQLRKLGWRIIIIWQCKLKTPKMNSTFNRLIRKLLKK